MVRGDSLLLNGSGVTAYGTGPVRRLQRRALLGPQRQLHRRDSVVDVLRPGRTHNRRGLLGVWTAARPGDGWELRWSFSAGQEVTQSWNGRYTQSGAQVVVTNEAWNGTVPAGATVTVGFRGTWHGTNPPPVSFVNNGTVCATS